MNQIQQMYNAISNEELMEAIREIQQSEETGIIGHTVRKYARASSIITNSETSTELLMTQINLLKQAAFRWTKAK